MAVEHPTDPVCVVCGNVVPPADGMTMFQIRILRRGRYEDRHVCALHVGEHIAEAVHAELERRKGPGGTG